MRCFDRNREKTTTTMGTARMVGSRRRLTQAAGEAGRDHQPRVCPSGRSIVRTSAWRHPPLRPASLGHGRAHLGFLAGGRGPVPTVPAAVEAAPPWLACWSSRHGASRVHGHLRCVMEYVNLGETGLRVSRVCLGMMSFGNDSDRPWVLDEDAAEPIVRAAVEGGITFFDTADTYSNGASEVATGRLVGKMLSRDEVVIATKVFMPVTPGENGGGPLAQAHPVRHRRVAAPAGHGLRRSLPDPPLGRPDADRGDDGRAARCRARRKGPLHRGQQHVRLAVRQGPVHAPTPTAGPASSPCSPTTTSSTAKRSAR